MTMISLTRDGRRKGVKKLGEKLETAVGKKRLERGSRFGRNLVNWAKAAFAELVSWMKIVGSLS